MATAEQTTLGPPHRVALARHQAEGSRWQQAALLCGALAEPPRALGSTSDALVATASGGFTMVRPRLLFVSHSATAGGHITFIRRGLEYLVPHADRALVDETPQRVIEGLAPVAASGVRLWELPLWSDRRQAARQLADRLRVWSPDWVMLDNPALLVMYTPVLRLARQRSSMRLQYTVHSGILRMTPRRRLLEVAAAMALRHTDRVVCVSEYTRSYWHRRYPWLRGAAWEVVHNGVPLPASVPYRPSRRLQVGFVGRLDPEKDPELYCRIATLAQGAAMPADFHVFGDGNLGPQLRQRYGQLLRFHGHVREVSLVYPAIDVLVVTSPVENCPYSVLEARSYGVPTVAPVTGGLPEIIEHGVDGVLCQRRDETHLLAGLREAARNLEALRRGSERSRVRFSLQTQGDKLWLPLLSAHSEGA